MTSAQNIDSSEIIAPVINQACDQISSFWVALAMNLTGPDMITLWSHGEFVPSDEEQQRFIILVREFDRVAAHHDQLTARRWLVSQSIDDGKTSPLEAIAEDRFDVVSASASFFVQTG